MNEYHVTVDLQFEVTVPVEAENEEQAEQHALDMSLSELLDWSGCASYNANVLEVSDE